MNWVWVYKKRFRPIGIYPQITQITQMQTIINRSQSDEGATQGLLCSSFLPVCFSLRNLRIHSSSLCEPAMIDHQTSILHNFDSGPRQFFRDLVVIDTELHPD